MGSLLTLTSLCIKVTPAKNDNFLNVLCYGKVILFLKYLICYILNHCIDFKMFGIMISISSQGRVHCWASTITFHPLYVCLQFISETIN